LTNGTVVLGKEPRKPVSNPVAEWFSNPDDRPARKEDVAKSLKESPSPVPVTESALDGSETATRQVAEGGKVKKIWFVMGSQSSRPESSSKEG
jgi:hypothetical protein